MLATVSEIHRYPVRPPGFEEPLFATAESRRTIAEHLASARALPGVGTARREWPGRSSLREPAHVLRRADGRAYLVRRCGKECRKGSLRKRRVVRVLERWREVGSWWDAELSVDRLVFRVLLAGGAVVDLALERPRGVAAHGRGGLTGGDGQSQARASPTFTSRERLLLRVRGRHPTELATAAAELGMEALALTDRDGLYGIPRFFEAAAGAGVSPVVGVEISVAEPGNPGGHLVLLADGMAGYRSLCRLITRYRCGSEDRRKPLCPFRYYWSTRRARLPHRCRFRSGTCRVWRSPGGKGGRTGRCVSCGRPSGRTSTSSSPTTGPRGAGGGWGVSRSSPGATDCQCSPPTR